MGKKNTLKRGRESHVQVLLYLEQHMYEYSKIRHQVGNPGIQRNPSRAIWATLKKEEKHVETRRKTRWRISHV